MKNLEEYKKALRGPEGQQILYQPLEHPAFSNWAIQQPCEERWVMMQPIVEDLPKGRCLDLGCHTGWFCRKFSHLGWEVLGVDRSKFWLGIAKSLMKPYNGIPTPIYYRCSIGETPLPKADVILCLSVLMYLFSIKDRNLGWKLLNNISQLAPLAFIDFGGKYADSLPFTEATFKEQVIQNTDYTSCELLGHTSLQDRPFFLVQ